MNSVNIVGRIGSDAESRFFESGKSLCQFRIAVDNGRDRDPFWFTVKHWLKESSTIQNFLTKGTQVGISGRLEQESWTDRETGAKRSKVVIVAPRIDLLGSKSEAPSTHNPSPAHANEPTGTGWAGEEEF